MKIPWIERINMLIINPDAARPEDIARMATELSGFYCQTNRLYLNFKQMHVEAQVKMDEQS